MTEEAPDEGADIVLRGGRVIDPESGLDAAADVAVTGRQVTQIGNPLPHGQASAASRRRR